MAQGKSGTRLLTKDNQRPLDLPRRGAPKAAGAAAEKKAALLARMKAAAGKKTGGETA